MDILAFVIYSGRCGACTMFKMNNESTMLKVMEERGIKVIKKEAKSPSEGLGPDVEPRFLSYVKFYPCIILIESKVLRGANKLHQNLLLSLISVFNGETLKGGAYINISNPQLYANNREGFEAFIQDFIYRRTEENNILYPEPQVKETRGIKLSVVNVNRR